MRRAPLLLAAAPVLALLIALGWWQLQRLYWKQGLLATIADAEAGPALPLRDPPEPWTKVRASGRLDHGREALLELEARGGVLGSRLLVPLLREDGPPVLLDRGWVPIERRGAIPRPEDVVEVEAFVRAPERAGWFGAADDVAQRRFYTFDPAAIGRALGLPDVAPYGLVALGPPGLPDPARTLPRPPNNHLGYVLTWWGLAAALVVVLALRLRRSGSPAR
jgi:surfeit locus 1 family protein